MSSARHLKSSSARAGLSSLFSSYSDHRELTGGSYDSAEVAELLSESENDDVIESGFQMYDGPASDASLSSGDEDEPDIGSITAAVKDSLAVEIQGQDGRERVEIRKGILHHQVMELQRSERQRQFGDSNYDGIFWSSEGGSLDDRLDNGIE
jgi:hypothetical protein